MHVIHPPPKTSSGLSLVELLIVMGITTVLVSLLMPTLAKVREHGNRVKCAANLRPIGFAAQMHAIEHAGYFPTAGWQWDATNGIADPAGLDDAAEKKYMYYVDSATKRPLPITAALGNYLGTRVRTDSRAHLEADLQSESLRQYFRCPRCGNSTQSQSHCSSPKNAKSKSLPLVRPIIILPRA